VSFRAYVYSSEELLQVPRCIKTVYKYRDQMWRTKKRFKKEKRAHGKRAYESASLKVSHRHLD
jgi:hypothetical protein